MPLGNRPLNPWLVRQNIPSLFGLRALSILLVLTHHLTRVNGSPLAESIWKYADWGKQGVNMFFVISGFLITLILTWDEQARGKVSLKRFYLNRAFRILPAYFCFILGTAVLSKVGFLELSRLDWLTALTYTTNFPEKPGWGLGHLWSLSIEEQFYLVWPLVFATLAPKGRLKVSLACVFLAPISRMLFWGIFFSTHEFFNWPMFQLDGLAMGCTLGCLLTNEKWWARLQVSARSANLLMAGFLGGLLSIILWRGQFHWLVRHAFELTATQLCFSGIILISVTHPREWFGRVLNSKTLVYLGTLSYSLYLWQQPFFSWFKPHFLSTWPMNMVFAFVMALMSYYLVERPFLRLREKVVK